MLRLVPGAKRERGKPKIGPRQVLGRAQCIHARIGAPGALAPALRAINDAHVAHALARQRKCSRLPAHAGADDERVEHRLAVRPRGRRAPSSQRESSYARNHAERERPVHQVLRASCRAQPFVRECTILIAPTATGNREVGTSMPPAGDVIAAIASLQSTRDDAPTVQNSGGHFPRSGARCCRRRYLTRTRHLEPRQLLARSCRRLRRRGSSVISPQGQTPSQSSCEHAMAATI